jgi:hypothetical protein
MNGLSPTLRWTFQTQARTYLVHLARHGVQFPIESIVLEIRDRGSWRQPVCVPHEAPVGGSGTGDDDTGTFQFLPDRDPGLAEIYWPPADSHPCRVCDTFPVWSAIPRGTSL